MTTAGDQPQYQQDDEGHWRARRLRKRVDARRRREKEESLVGRDEEKKQTRDAASLRALQVVPHAKRCSTLLQGDEAGYSIISLG